MQHAKKDRVRRQNAEDVRQGQKDLEIAAEASETSF